MMTIVVRCYNGKYLPMLIVQDSIYSTVLVTEPVDQLKVEYRQRISETPLESQHMTSS